MKAPTRRLLALTPLAASLLVLGPGCSGPGEDVRITLCKDMAALLGAHGEGGWDSAVAQTARFEDLVITLTARAGDDRATCRYGFDSDAEEHALPGDALAVYDTYPRAMTLNGALVDRERLADLVQQAMLKQGRELAEEARARIEETAERLEQGLSGGR